MRPPPKIVRAYACPMCGRPFAIVKGNHAKAFAERCCKCRQCDRSVEYGNSNHTMLCRRCRIVEGINSAKRHIELGKTTLADLEKSLAKIDSRGES